MLSFFPTNSPFLFFPTNSFFLFLQSYFFILQLFKIIIIMPPKRTTRSQKKKQSVIPIDESEVSGPSSNNFSSWTVIITKIYRFQLTISYVYNMYNFDENINFWYFFWSNQISNELIVLIKYNYKKYYYSSGKIKIPWWYRVKLGKNPKNVEYLLKVAIIEVFKVILLMVATLVVTRVVSSKLALSNLNKC